MKKNLLTLILCLIVLISITACEKENDDENENVIFVDDSVIVNQKLTIGDNNSASATFCMYFVSHDTDVNIQLQEITGDNLEGMSFSSEIVFEDFAQDYTYEGYTAGTEIVNLEFSDLNDGDTAEISSMTFSVNGKKVEVIPKNEIKYEFYDSNSFDNSTMHMNRLATAMLSFDLVVNSFGADEDITVKEISYNGLVNINDLNVCINDVSKGDENVFPVELKSGDELELYYECEPVYSVDHPINIYTNTIVFYENAAGEELTFCYDTCFVTINNSNDIDKLVDYCFK